MNWVSHISRRIGLSNVRRVLAMGFFVATIRLSNKALKRSYFTQSMVGACTAFVALKLNSMTETYRIFSIWTTLLAIRCILPDIPFGPVISMYISANVFIISVEE